MKREEAEQVFQMVSAIYDLHPERAGDLAPVWVTSLERRDAAATMDVVGRWIEGRGAPEKMPSLGLFVAIVKSEENKTREPVDCEVCVDGWVSTGRRVYLHQGRETKGEEQMAPCPSCDPGKLIEFPLDGVGAWGEDGFWRGRGWKPIPVDDKVGPGCVEILS